MRSTLKDEKGKTYGYLTVIELVPTTDKRGALWRCKCQCGNYTNVTGCNLRTGHVSSCGCLRLAKAAENFKAGRAKGERKAKNKSVTVEKIQFTEPRAPKKSFFVKADEIIKNYFSRYGRKEATV